MGVWCFDKKRINSDVESDPNNPNFYCKYCDKNFENKYNFDRHLFTGHGVNDALKKAKN
jgi:hypothetical protein